MNQAPPVNLLLSTSPFLKQQQDSHFIMWQVVGSLVPIILAATWYYGVGALLLVGTCVVAAVGTEYALQRGSIRDGSAMITGILLALTLPPALPLWMAFLGGVVAILLGKLAFGGLGQNIFNPALVGRIFLQSAFPSAMTTWSLPAAKGAFFSLPSSTLAWPFMHGQVDAMSGATPLADFKFNGGQTPLANLLWGNTGGSLGETCAVVILLCGVYLAVRGLLNWRIPLSIFLTVVLLSLLGHHLAPTRVPGPLFSLLAGGLMLGAMFIATDMVTSPVTQRGCWVYGLGIGLMVMVIRCYGGPPEAVMYAILLFNGLTPIINRYTQPLPYGARAKP